MTYNGSDKSTKSSVGRRQFISAGGAITLIAGAVAASGGAAKAALTRTTMTNAQRKSVVLEYLKAFDRGGKNTDGSSILDLFADDAQVYFPKWGLANGKKEIGKLFGAIGSTLKAIRHDYSDFNWIFSGSDTLVCEGTSYGVHRDGPWRAGVPEWGAGRWCDVFEIRDWKIQRVFIYLDPDYAGKDTARYPWLAGKKT